MEGGDQISQIKKRIRTKRERPSSPFISSTAVTSTSSSSNRESSSSPSPADDYNSTVTDSSVPAAAAVASSAATDWGEEEEEDDMVAICLIMLAHGSGRPTRTTPVKPIPPKKPETNDTINPNNNLFIYECKTCNRTFSTFQALGGHRASHKRPKITAAAAEEKPKPTEQGQNGQFTVITGIPTNNKVVVNKVNKIHECSICGSEFTSGQALGGHMRRHRAVATAERRNNDQAGTGAGNKDGSRKYLPLDLNLPAPEEDLRETKFQAGIVFSAPALVDCHY